MILENIVAVIIIIIYTLIDVRYGLIACIICISFLLWWKKSKKSSFFSSALQEGMSININFGNDDSEDIDDRMDVSDEHDVVESSIELVISRYNEDLQWLKKKPFNRYNTTIYNKGINNKFYKPSYLNKIVKLKNVGKCDHTYLYHIVQNYENLAEITVFLPGSCSMTSPHNKMKKTKQMLYEIRKNNQAVFIYDEKEENIQLTKYNFYLDNYETSDKINHLLSSEQAMEPAKIRPYGKWFEKRFGNINMKYISYGGIFSVAKSDILKHPRSYYENLISELNNSPNPEVGHYFERSWNAVFYPMNSTIFVQKL